MKQNFLFILACTMFFHESCKSHHETAPETIEYTVTKPLTADTSFNKEYVAQIQSVRNIEIRAQEKGYLQAIYVDEGQFVHAGQILFRIMPSLYEAELQKNEAEVKQAEIEYSNAKTLADKNIVSKSEAAMAQAKLDQAKAEVALAKLHLSFTEIRAPYDGVIDRLPLKLGSLIDEGALLTTLSDNQSVFAYFNVPETEYLDFRAQSDSGKKQPVSLKLANNQLHQYPGTVETIEGQFDNTTGNIAFRAKFPNPKLLLKHGETGKVVMNIPIRNALLIPQKATYELQDKVYVFVIDKNHVAHARNISIRNRLPDLYVVDAGISAEDDILLEGLQHVKDEEKVTARFIEPGQVYQNLQLIKQ